ncbi:MULTISPECIES: DUF6160 family protein [Acinetobacter]|uniref:Pilus assembly protein FilA n=1 Tax=Acinetobacter haemolyticus TaxID=29430 RepID=A0A6B2B464_ACIHA|nr:MULTISPECIES: DUF6160 family protein [Acinetobacter]ENU85542.1 hypothetical protein F973_02181 [Acinetobacter sp. CIP 102129]ENW19343.1 hypothetical protein F926_02910 [Acinetobacter haemolyticus NIPH 261]MBO3657867.1 pilus assembly protein FilA [Acinetobacter haemolyticus]MEB8380304.1 pilus assembly protein FilA [Acinetobacter junii]MQZ31282.1 pilus assembly protein FilA [Acinetobacter haemolyticus]
MNKKLGYVSLLLLSPFTMAMQPMDDQSLSLATGQDGLSITINTDLEFKQIAMIDKDGLSYTGHTDPDNYTNKAGLVVAGVAGTAAQNVKVSGLSAGSSTQLGLKAVIDTDRGTGLNGAFANIALSFDGVDGIRISPFSIYAAPSTALSTLIADVYTTNSMFGSGNIPKTNVKEILRSNSNIDIAFDPNNKPNFNIQLGAAPQNRMVLFGGGINSICGAGTGCNMILVSDYATAGDASTAPVGASFDLQLTGHEGNAFALNGFYAGIENTGLVFGNTGESSKFDLKLNNVTLGTAGQSATGTFHALPNASIGNVGITGASVTNLRVNVGGM